MLDLDLRAAAEEPANRVPYGFRRRQRVPARGVRRCLELLEQQRRLGLQRLLRDRRRLDVADVVGDLAELVQRRLRSLAVVVEVRAVGGVEHVSIEPARIVAVRRDLEHLLEGRRRDGAAAAADLEELGFRELPRFDGVRDEHGFQVRVLTTQALHDPEEKRLRELAVVLRHARRHVHREIDDGLRGRPAAHRELAVAQVVVRERRSFVLHGAALDRFLQRAAPVEPRAHAAAAPAFARVIVVLDGPRLDLQVRQLQLLPEPVDDVVDLELQDELVAALLVAARALRRRSVARLDELVAGLAGALADAFGLLGVAQAQARVLEETNRDLDRAIGARQELAARDELGQLVADGRAHLVVMPQPVAGAAREEVVQLAPGTRGIDETGRRCHFFQPSLAFEPALLLRQQCGHVVERFLRAVLVVAIFLDEALLHRRDLVLGLVVGPRLRRHEPQYVAALLEQVLLDGLVQARVIVERELLAGLERDHRLAHHFLPERQLAGLGDLDLLLDRAQEPLVGRARIARDRILDLALVERGLDLVEVLLEQLLRFLLERREQRAVHVLLDPAVVEVLAGEHEELDPLLLAARVHARVRLDGVLEREQHVHARQALHVVARDRVADRVDDEARAHARQTFVGRLGADARHVGGREALDVLVGVELELLREIQALARRLLEAREDGEHGREIDDVRVEVHLAERRRARHELAIDARFVAERQRVRHLDDHHAIEQRLVLFLLQELVELGQVRVREDRLVEVDQREARDLDVLLLRQRQEQIQELALDLEYLDHLEHAAARGVDGARPRPCARVAFVADVGDLREIHGAHQIRDVGRRRVVRRVRADTYARGLREEDTFHGELHEVAPVFVIEARSRVRRELALNIDAVRLAKLRPHARWNQIQRRLVQRRAMQRVQRAVVGVAVFLEPALHQDHERRLAARRWAEQQQQSSTDVGTGGCGFEVIDDALESAVDAEQLAGEQRRGRGLGFSGSPHM